MCAIAGTAENVVKLYRLGQIGTGTISHDLNRWWARMRGKEDPFAKIGETNDRATKGENEYVWALKEIDFEIKKGEAVGIIGRNGAGKSTLLKLLSKVTKPTTGEIKIKGRIASLLEVGTGFHPEMTGKENIYMNGAILGMTKKEITRKFDEIVDFSGVERYIDTPVKRYSSGMYVRLAFAVAAHLESEILIVDEVLAVGDAEFQKKCLGKMGDVSKGEGRTVLFVSHNMLSIKQLCEEAILLKDGLLKSQGNVEEILELYNTEMSPTYEVFPNIHNHIYLSQFKSYNKRDRHSNIVTKETATFEFDIFSKIDAKDVRIGIGINDNLHNRLITPYSLHCNQSFNLKEGTNRVFCEIDDFPLKSGDYDVEIYIGAKGEMFDYYDKGLKISVNDNALIERPDHTQGYFVVNQKWTKNE